VTDHILGPIDYLAVEFPGARITGEGFGLLMDLVQRGTVRVLDLEFVMKADDGSVSKVALRDLEHGGDIDATVWDGAASGLLDEADLAEVAAAVEPGSLAGILVYENTWAVPLMSALDRGSARLVGWDRISAAAVAAALDADPS
jgi:hypothetical protein